MTVGEQDDRALPDLRVDAGRRHLRADDRIRRAEHLEPLGVHLTDDPDSQTRARERVPLDDRGGQPEFGPEQPHLVLEQGAQRLDQLELEVLRQPADVVVRLDGGRAGATAGLDDIRVEGALDQEPDSALLRADIRGRTLEDPDELAADDLAFGLRVAHPGQRRQEPF